MNKLKSRKVVGAILGVAVFTVTVFSNINLGFARTDTAIANEEIFERNPLKPCFTNVTVAPDYGPAFEAKRCDECSNVWATSASGAGTCW